MYSLKSLWDIFKLEIFLFGGVPETATEMHDSGSYGHEEIRATRDSLQGTSNLDFDQVSVCSRVRYSFEKKEYEIVNGPN